MKKYTVLSTVAYLISISLYVAAIVTFARETNTSVGTILLCAGSAFFSAGLLFSNKQRAQGDPENNDPKP